ncbi:hypothetical protein [Oceanobacter mangrovi]|uniref:hypothetical protein n=1 Tax=Oceanobacter mangrovi TaxID=2862510 RepID=UPI001C8E4522|nr:hypothetical protein [Oceanobacter mangrovi]
MREVVRQQYLRAMGIPVWIPRQSLPNAAASQLQPFLENDDSLHGSGELPAGHLPDFRHAEDRHVGGHMVAQLLDHGQQNHAGLQTAAKVEAPAVAESDKPVTNTNPLPIDEPVDLTPPRFELHFVKFGDELVWVCDDFNELGNLLAFAPRVCAAMGWEVLRSEPVMFRWPFIEHAREDQGAAVAEQALRAQWSYFAHHGARQVIGFGEQSQRWLRRIETPGCYMSESVSAVMADGRLKKQLWLQLVSLKGVLA